MEGLEFPWAIFLSLKIIVDIIKCKQFMTNTATLKDQSKNWKVENILKGIF